MNPSRVRVSSLLALLVASPVNVQAQNGPPPLWFQGTRLIFEHAVPGEGDLAVSTRDAGLRRFLDRLGATVAYQPGQRFVVITAQDRRTIVFALGDPSYTVAGVRVQAAFAPTVDGNSDVNLPFYALARALYVEPVPAPGEIVLQPRIGALDVQADGPRTVVTVRGAMPLVTTTNAETPDRIQLSFAGLGTALASARRAPGSAVDGIDVAVGGNARVPTTTITINGARGATHRIVPSGSPDAYTVVFESQGGAAYAPPTPPPFGSPGSATPPPLIVAGRATVTDFSIDPADNDALAVRVSLSGAVGYEWHRLNDNRWYVDLLNTTLSGPGRDEQPQVGAVQSVRVRQTGSTDAPVVRVAFTLTGQPRVELTPSDAGLVITVYTDPSTDIARVGAGRTGGAPVVASAVSPEPSPAETTPAWKFTPGNGSKTIVLDPGHGGD
ncbi:MAG: AMIN domain-containing protein, partial [Candidatus Eremiobacteraeota bacterium]|nr:AMIN domain-containing protein [Candidatus Eremiobacteraeota bacterium]